MQSPLLFLSMGTRAFKLKVAKERKRELLANAK